MPHAGPAHEGRRSVPLRAEGVQAARALKRFAICFSRVALDRPARQHTCVPLPRWRTIILAAVVNVRERALDHAENPITVTARLGDLLE
jgi:hypothetical protein